MNAPKLKILSRQVQGLAYLLSHPLQLKWIIIRETRYRQRHRNKRKWMEWQKYDAQMHIRMMQAQVHAVHATSLNMSRVQIFCGMMSHIGSKLRILDVWCGDGVISEPIWKMGNDVASLELPEIAKLASLSGLRRRRTIDEQLRRRSATPIIPCLFQPSSHAGLRATAESEA